MFRCRRLRRRRTRLKARYWPIDIPRQTAMSVPQGRPAPALSPPADLSAHPLPGACTWIPATMYSQPARLRRLGRLPLHFLFSFWRLRGFIRLRLRRLRRTGCRRLPLHTLRLLLPIHGCTIRRILMIGRCLPPITGAAQTPAHKRPSIPIHPTRRIMESSGGRRFHLHY